MNDLTTETNSKGFYLWSNGDASPYNESGHTKKDVHEMNMEAKMLEKEIALLHRQLTRQTMKSEVKALASVKLVEITLVLAIETYSDNHDGVCAMDYITTSSDVEVIGWDERTLEANYKKKDK